MSFPKRGKRPPVELTWRDGANCHPEIPEKFWDNGKAPKLGGAGTVLYSQDGRLAITRGSHSSTSTIIPTAEAKALGDELKTSSPKLNHQTAFTQACLGNGKTMSPFSIGADLTKTLMLGVVCQFLNEELEFDRKTERFQNNARANALLDGPEPRKGWGDFYKIV
jgi:hypothetical protein